MADLTDATDKVMEEGKNAGHAWTTVWVSLHQVSQTGSVNDALTEIWDTKGRQSPPRWLVVRWARMAGLVDPSPKRPA